MLTEMQHNTLLETYGLAIDGNVGYFIDNDRVIINIDGIRSDRAEGNVSGTLSLELWALNTPYTGQDFEGQALAGTQIGEMLGQHYLAGCEYDLIFNAPGAGNWALCLMLREWNGEHYETRDYRNFDVPFVVEADLRLVETEKNDEASDTNVVDINRKRDAEVVNKEIPKVAEKTPEKAKKSEPVKAQPKAETVVKKDGKKSESVEKTTEAKKPEPVAKKSPEKKSTTVEKAATVEKSETKKTAEKMEPVSVNKASAAELAAVKGLSTKQAEAIVAARPYKSINDVVKAKGMGAKLLEKIRGSLKI